jgi:hypothetical protein
MDFVRLLSYLAPDRAMAEETECGVSSSA